MSLALTTVAPHEIIKEGWLQKKGKTFRQWRPRWVVLTAKHLYTFTNKKEYTNPTETIELSSIVSITTTEQKNEFCIQGSTFFCSYFKCVDCPQRKEWMNIIEGYKHAIQISVTIECAEHKEYCNEFRQWIPFHKKCNYKIKTLIMDVVVYIEHKHHPIKFYATKINEQSFIEQTVYDWMQCNANITDYDKDSIISKGLHISVHIRANLCPNILTEHDLCTIYERMRYHREFTEEGLNHLFEFKHFENECITKPECTDGEECISYKRLLDGGNHLKDRCHVKIYRHHHFLSVNSNTTDGWKDSIEGDIVKNGEILDKLSENLQVIDIKKWQNSRNYAILQIMTLADGLEKVVRDVGIAKTAGGGSAIVGGILSVTGLALVPVSAGASLGLSVAGASMLIAGGMTTLISDAIKHLKEKGIVKRCIEAYEEIQPDTRKLTFLLDDYNDTFRATGHNISVFASLCLVGNGISKVKSVSNLITISKGLKAYTVVKAATGTAVEITEFSCLEIAESALLSGAKYGEKVIYTTGSIAAKCFGYIGGGLGVVFGIWDMVDGIKTINDAENAIHRLRVLAIEIDKQTDAIMEGYNKILKLHQL